MALCSRVMNQYRGALFVVLTKRNLNSTLFPVLHCKLLLSDNSILRTVSTDGSADTRISKEKQNTYHANQRIYKLIERLSKIVTIEPQSNIDTITQLQTDVAYKNAIEELESVASTMKAGQLLKSLSLLIPLSVHDSSVVKTLETRCLLLIERHMSISQLVDLVQLYSNVKTKAGQEIFSQAWSYLDRRWVEITTGSNIITLLHCTPTGSDKFLARLETRALDMCESFSLKELYRIFYLLARRGHRNAPLIRALVYHLSMKELDLSAIHLANLAFALATLNVHNSAIMDTIVDKVILATETQQDQKAVVALLSSVVQSFGILRHCNTGLLDTAAGYFMNNKSVVESDDWSKLLNAAAWLGVVPEPLKNGGVAEVMHIVCESRPINELPSSLLDIVWSCSLLSEISPKTAAMVLKQEFLEKVTKINEISLMSVYMKLLNINAIANSAIPDYDGPLLSTEFISTALKQIQTTRARKRGHLFDSVFEALSQMASAKRYLKTDIVTTVGCVIDIEMLINNSAEPQVLSGAKSSGNSLASEYHRIAFLLHDFSDMTFGSVHPNGPRSFSARLLASQGYKVIQIPYTEFAIGSTVVKRVQYLHGAMKNALSAHVTASSTETADVSATSAGDETEGRGEWVAARELDSVSKKSDPSRNAESPSVDAVGTPTGKGQKASKGNSTRNSRRSSSRVKLDVGSLFAEENSPEQTK